VEKEREAEKKIANETRVAKCDMTNFLIPGVEVAFRPLFEVLWRDEDDQDCTAIAINAARLGNDIEQSLDKSRNNVLSEVSSAGSTNKDSKIHVIFSFSPFDYEEEDVILLGIYKDKTAMN